jgi:ubiquinone/menaquinone biosynthesis C-methylase UbiE
MSVQDFENGRAVTDVGPDPRQLARQAWSLGDYHRFAKRTVWAVGPVLVEACGIRAGQRVLDVGAGSGNVALRAAATGALVIASDLTPAAFAAGREEARELGVYLQWVEADAASLPFPDEEFDVVTSCFGAMFAPDHRAVADELLRVCRPGGTLGLASFTPEGLGGDFFGVLDPYLPPTPPAADGPLSWGRETHVRDLFGTRLESLTATRRTYVETAADPRAYRDLFRSTFGPVVALYAGLAAEPERLTALDRALLDFATRADEGPPGGPAEYPYEYVIMLAQKAQRR